MGIENIEIENYKSIKKCKLNLKQLNVLIGENGCGKTNIISAIKYFYSNLISENDDNEIFDKNNSFNNTVKIKIQYDCKELRKIISNKIKNESMSKYTGEKKEKQNLEYYEKIRRLIHKDKITLELTKTKKQSIKWNIESRADREIIYNIFPIYNIDAKNISVESWDLLWKEIGDLIKIENSVATDFQQKIVKILEESQDKKIAVRLSELEKVLIESDIQIKKYTQREYATAITKMYYNGERFEISEHKPDYYSEGTNSFNYINTLINIVNAIKTKKIKFPTIIMDEPEISLHHKFIDKMSENIIDKSKKIQFLLATHSSRLLKNILKEESDDRKVFNLRYKNKYTYCSEMKLLDEKRQMTFIEDEHVNCYFSDMLILVEGESELELLNNKYLKIVYPFLKNIDIIKASSNKVIENSLLPNKRNYKTPYLIIIDMDKIIKKNKEQNKMDIKSKDGYFVFNNKENFYYGEKRIETYYKRKRIEKMTEKCRFHYQLPFYSCNDENFNDLKNCIKEYFLNYNIFVNETTLEGLLVNNENYFIFWEFYKKVIKKQENIEQIEKYYDGLKEYDKVNLLRLLVSGKTDYILKLSELDKIPDEIKNMIQKNTINKTSGWISLWIEYYLMYSLKIDYSNDKNKYKKLNNELVRNKEQIKIGFCSDFIELSNLLKEIAKRYSN